jgi:hypothetical protein
MGWFVAGNKAKESIKNIPNVLVRERLKKVEISGRSRMTDPCDFYEKLQSTLEECYRTFHNTIILEFKFEYINTGSSKLLYHMLSYLQSLASAEGIVEVTWFYEEDDEIIEEAGEVLQSLLSIPFHLKEI